VGEDAGVGEGVPPVWGRSRRGGGGGCRGWIGCAPRWASERERSGAAGKHEREVVGQVVRAERGKAARS
jgi:hypothetical protein